MFVGNIGISNLTFKQGYALLRFMKQYHIFAYK